MMYFSRLKATLVLGVCLLGALLCLPNVLPAPVPWLPWHTISLGLDLRGGSYLLMQVDMNAVIRERLDGLADAARTDLRRAGIVQFTVTPQPKQERLLVAVSEPGKQAAAHAALERLIRDNAETTNGAPDLLLSTTPSGALLVTLSPQALTARAIAAVQQSIEIVRRRIDQTGVVDPQIEREGTSRIVVQLPGIQDPNRIKELLGKTAHMTFRLVAEDVNPNVAVPPPGVEFLPDESMGGQKLAVRKRVEVDGANLTDARAATNPETGQWVVNFTLDSVGARRFANVTRNNVGHRFAIVLDNKIISAPVIREPITGGRGRFQTEHDHYDPVPEHLVAGLAKASAE